MKRVAIIDLGTNTFNLLIVELSSSSSPNIIFKTKLPVKLGQGGINAGVISKDAFLRGLSALANYQAKIEEFGVKSIYPIATAAIRSAKNGADFVKEVSQMLQMEINVISGDEEATLIYCGVTEALSLGANHSLIMDIGGGSTEFIIGTEEEILWKKSFDIGVARVLDKFQITDPMSTDNIAELQAFFLVELDELFKVVNDYEIDTLVGSSGSFESLAEIIQHRNGNRDAYKGKTEYTFDLSELENLHADLLKSTSEDRGKMKGLVDYRIETIALASIFIDLVIKKLNISNLRLSTYSLREGVMSELKKQ